MGGQLGCFPILANVNNAANNSGVHVSPGDPDFNYFDTYQQWDCRACGSSIIFEESRYHLT